MTGDSTGQMPGQREESVKRRSTDGAGAKRMNPMGGEMAE